MKLSFEIKNISRAESHMPDQGTWLWIWHPDKIPPHAGLSSNGLYYSLKAKRRDYELQTQQVWRLIDQQNIPLILVKLQNVDCSEIQQIFQKYKSIIIGLSTCLSPISEVLIKDRPVGFLADLLTELRNRNQIQGYFGLHLPQDFKGLSTYGIIEIQKRIKELQDAEGRKFVSAPH